MASITETRSTAKMTRTLTAAMTTTPRSTPLENNGSGIS